MSLLWPPRLSPAINYISEAPSSEYCTKTPRNLTILGSTGSIGRNALAVISQMSQFFKITALAAGRNVTLLAQQAILHKPDFLAVIDKNYAAHLRELLPKKYKPEILWGSEGYAELSSLEQIDCVLSAQVGSAGLAGTLAAALKGKVIALANKESLVLAGGLLRNICAQSGASILPVDSEHYAIFQCLAGRGKEVSQIILTASGGPFRGKKTAELKNIDAKDALNHPNWKMGSKISIDSATLMNKGLEFIEALHLFGVTEKKMDIIVHPQSIVHSLVRFTDNSVLAQFAVPDMRLPIGACLTWPDNQETFIPALDLTLASPLAFEKADETTFPCLSMAKKAADWKENQNWLNLGINPACIVLCGANEAAVELFLGKRCSFCDIPTFIKKAMDKILTKDLQPESYGDPHHDNAINLAEIIMKLNEEAREEVEKMSL